MEDALTSPDSTGDEPQSSSAPEYTLQEISSWLAVVKPAVLMPLFREPDFLLIGISAFTGFRMNAQGYANPLVKQRLAQEAIKDSKFAEKLRDLAENPPAPRVMTAPPAPAKPAVESPIAVPSSSLVSEELKTKARERRRERDEARQALSKAHVELAQAVEERKRAEAEYMQLQRTSERQAQRIARQDRQITKLQAESQLLLRTQISLKTTEETVQPREEIFSAPQPRPQDSTVWQRAILHLLERSKYETIIPITEEVLRMQPDERTALRIDAKARAALNDQALALQRYRDLITAALAQGSTTDAIDGLSEYLQLQPDVSDAKKVVRTFLTGLRLDRPETVSYLQLALTRLRTAQPKIHAWLQSQMRAVGSPALKQILSPAPGTPGIDDPLPITNPHGPLPITARRIVDAIDGGDPAIVDAARTAIADLRRSKPAVFTLIKTLITQAADGDSSYFSMLRQPSRGPIVVDGSNVAWFDQDTLVHGRPRLRSLVETRRGLRARGYFPVVLYGDAPLPYTIDDTTELARMQSRQEIEIVDPGVDADEVLLREAKRLHAPVLTNDYMADWDPNDEVVKIPFTISLDGSVQLLSDGM